VVLVYSTDNSNPPFCSSDFDRHNYCLLSVQVYVLSL
jgi:hypothetical protein